MANIPGKRVIPLHKLVVFKKQGKIISGTENAQFIYDDTLSFDISTQYGPLLENRPNNLLSLLSSSFSLDIGGKFYGVPSGQFALQSFQVWQSTEPLDFTLGLKLFMQNDAFKDVVSPALILSKQSAPQKTDTIGSGLIPPGPNIKDIMALAGYKTGNTDWGPVHFGATNSTSSGTVDVHIGHFWVFQNCVLTKVNPTFSEAKDYNLAPISCELAVSFRTSEVVTTNMIDEILRLANPATL